MLPGVDDQRLLLREPRVAELALPGLDARVRPLVPPQVAPGGEALVALLASERTLARVLAAVDWKIKKILKKWKKITVRMRFF